MTKAEEIARLAHSTQRDKSRAPYILHPERVALDLGPMKARIAAATAGPWVAVNAQAGIEEGCAWGVESETEVIILHDFVGPSNAEFIAHARHDIPVLIAEIERLRSSAATE